MPTPMNPETKQKLLELMWKGEPAKELATAFDVSVQFIYQLMKKEPTPACESTARYWREVPIEGGPPRRTCAWCGKKLRRATPPAEGAGLGYKGSDVCSEDCLYGWTHTFGGVTAPRGECWFCAGKCGWDEHYCSTKCETDDNVRLAKKWGMKIEDLESLI